MADIRKRTGKKGITYQIRYKQSDGKEGYKTFSTRREATEFLTSGESLKSRSIENTLNVSQAVDMWLDICKNVGRDGKEPIELTSYENYVNYSRVIKEYDWQSVIGGLVKSDIVQFRTWLLKNKTRDLSKRVLGAFKAVLSEMSTQGYLNGNPATGVSILSGGRHKAEVIIPTAAEIKSILKAADDRACNKNMQIAQAGKRYRAFIYLCIFTGMRPSEIIGLTKDSFNSDGVQVKQRVDRKGILGVPKSKSGYRFIYYPSFMYEMLKEAAKSAVDNKNNLIFVTSSGRPILQSNMRKHAWQPVCEATGLATITRNKSGNKLITPKYTLYSMRHFFASMLIENKMNLKFIQEQMGHADIQTTLDRYGKLIRDDEELRKEQIEKMAERLMTI